MQKKKAWASFCISTYKRPELLKKQLELLLNQTFPYFHIVISDNDPDASAKMVSELFYDPRIKYFHNGINLGMIKSFNKSIERSDTEFIVMVTDDDPVEKEFLQELHKIYKQYPEYGIYCGFERKKTNRNEVKFIVKENFILEILDPDKTPKILWSSCVIKRDTALQVGKIPDYGSPHLADHAFIVMAGSVKGGIVINKMYSSLTSHHSNFSKLHFESYVSGCAGFYETIIELSKGKTHRYKIKKAVRRHLSNWFISSFFNLKKYYSFHRDNPELLKEVNQFAQEILKLSFMKGLLPKFYAKQFAFELKKRLKLLK